MGTLGCHSYREELLCSAHSCHELAVLSPAAAGGGPCHGSSSRDGERWAGRSSVGSGTRPAPHLQRPIDDVSHHQEHHSILQKVRGGCEGWAGGALPGQVSAEPGTPVPQAVVPALTTYMGPLHCRTQSVYSTCKILRRMPESVGRGEVAPGGGCPPCCPPPPARSGAPPPHPASSAPCSRAGCSAAGWPRCG